MTPEFVIGFGQEAVKMVILIAAPMLGLGLIVGVMVSIFQAATQIQEMTLTFVPKILAVFIGLMLFAPWMLEKLISFTRYCISQIPLFIR